MSRNEVEITTHMGIVLREMLTRPDHEWSTSELREIIGFTVRPIATQLERLRQAGWVTSRLEDQSQVQGRGAWRFYRFTPEGLDRAQRAMAPHWDEVPSVREIQELYASGEPLGRIAALTATPSVTVRSLLTASDVFVDLPTTAKIIDDYRELGTVAAVVHVHGLSRDFVAKTLRDAGVPIRRRSPLPPPQRLAELYRGVSLEKLTREFHTSTDRIRDELTGIGVVIRSQGKRAAFDLMIEVPGGCLAPGLPEMRFVLPPADLTGSAPALEMIARPAYLGAPEMAALRWAPGTGEVSEVYVQPSWRRKGLATALLRAAQRFTGAKPVLWLAGERTALGQAWAHTLGAAAPSALSLPMTPPEDIDGVDARLLVPDDPALLAAELRAVTGEDVTDEELADQVDLACGPARGVRWSEHEEVGEGR